MMKSLKLAGLSLCVGAAAMLADFSGSGLAQASAQENVSLSDVLAKVRQARRESSAENQRREQQFLRERNNQQAELNRVRSQVNAEEAESDRLEALLEQNQATIQELDEELAEKNGEFQELFGAARSAASDLAAQIERSQISAQFPNRAGDLRELAETDTLPSQAQLELLHETMLQQIAEQGRVVTFDAPVRKADGTADARRVTRIGEFVTSSGAEFLVYDDQQAQLEFLARQPDGRATGAAKAVQDATGGSGFVRGVIDPSLGQLLQLVVESPTVFERIEQGRIVGYIILGIAGLGSLLGLYKWITLTSTAGAVSGQMRKKKASKSNPLGRVMLAYEKTQSTDVETVALKLDDAILKEVPKLEGGLNLVKVLAAVAPLLGLLGTVIGMINTFQAITLFGTGDPQIMAGGISEALVTTVLGLIAAIPLLLLHAFASGASRRITQILEEQAAGIVAEHAEGRAA
ncbi:MAG: MotA/TolQ/ExbB proton channel family protein [Pseudomonadota bacterium]